MKRRIVRRILLFFLAAVVCILIFKSVSALINQSRSTKILYSLSGIMDFLEITDEIKDQSSPAMLLYFNSECHFCREEMADLKSHIKDLSGIRIFLISHEPRDQGIRFLNSFHFQEYPDIVYPEIDPEKIIGLFSGPVPQLLLYRDNRLKKHFRGKVNMSAAIKYFE